MTGVEIARTLEPPGGWWQVATRNAIELIAVQLLRAEHEPSAVVENLGNLVNRLRVEYTQDRE